MTDQPEPDNACRPDCPTRTALAEALARLHPLTRWGGSVIAYQTVDGIPPGVYERWQAALKPAPEPAHDAGPDIAECAAADRAHWADKYDGEGR